MSKNQHHQQLASQRMKEINSVLSGLSGRWQSRHGGELPPGACMAEPVTMRTPFDELAEQEEAFTGEGEEAVRMFMEAHAALLDFLFADGPHPAKVMRRLYAWVKKYRPELIWDAGYRQMSVLLCESHGAMEWRIGALIDDFAEAKGLVGVKAPWQRNSDACEGYSKAQKGNANRVGGKKSAKAKMKKK